MGEKESKRLGVEIKIPGGVEVELVKKLIKFKGPKGEVKREISEKNIGIEFKDNTVILKAPKFNKVNKKIIKSYAAHIRNMVRGISGGYKYTLKICSGHFPMNVSVSNNQLIVKNFLGEKVPRTLKLKPGANVKVEGDIIVVEGPSKEAAGQISADIEQLTRRTGYDLRIFQDGIWIVSKDKEVK